MVNIGVSAEMNRGVRVVYACVRVRVHTPSAEIKRGARVVHACVHS